MTTSIWQATTDVPHFPSLTQNAKTDICVVGAGIAGLSVAYHLAREGKKVVVLDDGPIGSGETGRTTAHLTDAIDDRFYRLEHVHGPEEQAMELVVLPLTDAIAGVCSGTITDAKTIIGLLLAERRLAAGDRTSLEHLL